MKIRLPAAVRRQIEEAAKANNRTLNSEITTRLQRTFDEDAERQGAWLQGMQASPRIRMDKALMRVELELQRQINELETRVARLEKKD